MYNAIALITALILIYVSYEKNFLKYGLILGVTWAILQLLNLGQVMSIGVLPAVVSIIGYSIVAIVVGFLLRNMSSRFWYVILYCILFDILVYVFYRAILVSLILLIYV